MNNNGIELGEERSLILQNLRELEKIYPESKAVILTYKRDLRVLMDEYPEHYINAALIFAGFIPTGKNLDLLKVSLNLYRTVDGYNHFYLSSIGINNQDLVGLPGTVQVPGRAYYGISWRYDEKGLLSFDIKSKQTVDLIKDEPREYNKQDLYAINTMANMFKSMDPRNVDIKILSYLSAYEDYYDL